MFNFNNTLHRTKANNLKLGKYKIFLTYFHVQSFVMFLSSGWNTNFHLLSKWTRKPVALSVFHDKGTGLSFLVLGGKSGNQEQGQVSGCLVSAAVALLPSCRQLQMLPSPGQAKMCPWVTGQHRLSELLFSVFLGKKDMGKRDWWCWLMGKGPLDNFV